jgi:hypothetical protein
VKLQHSMHKCSMVGGSNIPECACMIGTPYIVVDGKLFSVFNDNSEVQLSSLFNLNTFMLNSLFWSLHIKVTYYSYSIHNVLFKIFLMIQVVKPNLIRAVSMSSLGMVDDKLSLWLHKWLQRRIQRFFFDEGDADKKY